MSWSDRGVAEPRGKFYGATDEVRYFDPDMDGVDTDNICIFLPE